jgi:hypothetical protein
VLPRSWINGILLAVLITGPLSVFGAQPALAAQQTEGKVCVLAYHDATPNKVRDPGEALLPDISVNLMVNQSVIIANYVTEGKEPYCFLNLPPQQYTVTFSSPLYTPSTSTGFSFELAPGETVERAYGALPKATPVDPSASASGLNIQMTTPVRIGLSAVAALFVMIFVAGLGLIVYGLFIRR